MRVCPLVNTRDRCRCYVITVALVAYVVFGTFPVTARRDAAHTVATFSVKQIKAIQVILALYPLSYLTMA
jgi:hypothetical protein